ncbi:hypothetical protein SAMN04488544_3365 [Microlunatus sagamiharensis]|uniref:YaaC-like Protein n=1 Tax=Microlunatus sagamiharensis TaxID=546874 RepID=A0A1H2N6F8_9ACTN|nr:hypothetical protein [Microlunatus sagamiharensis]SDV00741.1 hypothetical protein SAMN04488544_3365 [Microlunatus sagamiharensis]
MRKADFNAALEQGQQLAAAAASVGPETSPLLAFYALVQIGRAVAAASVRLTNSEWQGSGHGLACPDLDGVADRGIATLTLQGSTGSNSHYIAARALDGPPLLSPTTFGVLWSLLQLDEVVLPGSGPSADVLQVRAVGGWTGNSDPDARIYPILEGAPRRPGARSARRAAERLPWTPELERTYPRIASLRVEDDRPYVQYSLRGELLRQDAVLQVALREDISSTEAFRRVTSTYRGYSYVLPAIDESGTQAHPFLVWWEVLYALSRLARYKPREWLRLIDVSRHPDAAAIELGLLTVITSMPEIAFDALSRAADEDITRPASG